MNLGLREHAERLAAGHQLTVLNYHNTPPRMADELRAELTYLRDNYQLVSPEDLDEFTDSGRWPIDRPVAVPVFYEGYADHITVAAPICEELGITGWFAVCTGWVDTPPAAHEIFALSHTIRLVPDELNRDRIAMTWQELGELGRRHVVFPHTASHAALHDVVTEEDVARELREPLQRIEAATGIRRPIHAWLHGTPWGTNERLDQTLIHEGYRYVVSNTMVQRIA